MLNKDKETYYLIPPGIYFLKLLKIPFHKNGIFYFFGCYKHPYH